MSNYWELWMLWQCPRTVRGSALSYERHDVKTPWNTRPKTFKTQLLLFYFDSVLKQLILLKASPVPANLMIHIWLSKQLRRLRFSHSLWLSHSKSGFDLVKLFHVFTLLVSILLVVGLLKTFLKNFMLRKKYASNNLFDDFVSVFVNRFPFF